MAKCTNCDYPYATGRLCTNCGSKNPSGKTNNTLGILFVIIIIAIAYCK